MLGLVPDDLIHRVAKSSTDCHAVSLPFLPGHRTDSRPPEIVEFHELYWLLNFWMQRE